MKTLGVRGGFHIFVCVNIGCPVPCLFRADITLRYYSLCAGGISITKQSTTPTTWVKHNLETFWLEHVWYNKKDFFKNIKIIYVCILD